MNSYSFFWGCTIPARFPFMEKSARIVMGKLGIDFSDLDGFTCCPEKSLIKNMDEKVWKASAARNLAVAEKAGKNILTLCTGCYSVLKSVDRSLKTYPYQKNEINNILEKVNLSYDGKIEVKHFIDAIHDDIGLPKLKKFVTNSLEGIKIAVHGGCHLVRPSSSLQSDHPLRPVRFQEIVQALGAEIVKSDMSCCGGILDRVDQHENAMITVENKLNTLKKGGPDAITVVCPECFKSFDNNQFFLQKKGKEFNIPVITLPELIGLTMGITPEELGINEHKIDAEPFLAKLRKRRR